MNSEQSSFISMLKQIFKKINYKLFKILFIACILSLTACKTAVIIEENSQAIVDMENILVLPFKNMSNVYGENVNVRCPVCGKVLMVGKIKKNVEHDLTEHLYSLLKDRESIQLIPPNQAEGVLIELLSNSNISLSEKDMIIQAGRTLGADAVIYGVVYRYVERVGTKYAVDSPASVAFDIHLIHVADGSLLWSGYFDETQESLSQNLLNLGTFIKRRASWISAREMAMSGIEDIMKTFPKP